MQQQLTARLTRDAQVNTLENGRKVVNFDVAYNGLYLTSMGEPRVQTEYYQCSYWKEDEVAQFLTKGTMVELTGIISARVYKNKKKEWKPALVMNVSGIEILHYREAEPVETEADDTTETQEAEVIS